MWLLTIFSVILFIMFLFCAAFLIAEYGKKQTVQYDEYDKKYQTIAKVIRNYEVCEVNYIWIEKLFDNLSQCKYKNDEMTQVLYNEFRDRYICKLVIFAL